MKAIQWLKERVSLTVPSTIGFLLLAAALVYLCVRIVGNVAQKELKDGTPPENLNAVETVSPSAEPTPEADEAALILVPGEDALDPDDTAPDEEAIAALTPAPTPAPSPTPRPLVIASKFNKAHMDVLLVGVDKNGQADTCAIVALRGDSCRLIFVPRNTLSSNEQPLSGARDVHAAISRLEGILRVRFTYYLEFKVAGLPTLVDELNGVSLGTGALSGEQAAAYLESGGADEMLRIERQQTLLAAVLKKAQHTNWLRLIALKYALADYHRSNLMLTQSVEIFSALNRVGADDIVFLTLPVDSVMLGQTRCYQMDAYSAGRILDELYPAN